MSSELPPQGAPSVSSADLAAAIRKDSVAYSLTTRERLEALYPEADLSSLLEAAQTEFPDIRTVAGERVTYYYSSSSMTEAYATHLARVEDKDPLRLIAETVRDESRIYPRPTAVKAFSEAPFVISPSDVASALARLGKEAGVEDIESCTASNGAVYLYSTRYLTPAHAQGLTEYYEVERWMNP